MSCWCKISAVNLKHHFITPLHLVVHHSVLRCPLLKLQSCSSFFEKQCAGCARVLDYQARLFGRGSSMFTEMWSSMTVQAWWCVPPMSISSLHTNGGYHFGQFIVHVERGATTGRRRARILLSETMHVLYYSSYSKKRKHWFFPSTLLP